MNQPSEIVLTRSITRADGTQRPGDEERVVSYWHRNPLRRLQARLRGIKGKVTPYASGSQASS